MSAVAALPFCHYRYLLLVSYFGTRYHGSQRLSAKDSLGGGPPSIQETLEVALGNCIPRERCRLTSGSRTDKGVHALMNVYSLPLIDYSKPTAKIKTVMNHFLGNKYSDIVVKDILLVPSRFHPRADCVSREYIFRVAVPGDLRHTTKQDQLAINSTNLFPRLAMSDLYRALPVAKLDFDKAQQVMQLYSGQHDFRSFAHRAGPETGTIRTVETSLEIEGNNDTFEDKSRYPYTVYRFRFKSDTFLWNQIRKMMGALLSYASYDRVGLDALKAMLDKPDLDSWNARMILAEPYGLYLRRLNYNRAIFAGSKRTYEDGREEDADPQDIECASDEVLSEEIVAFRKERYRLLADERKLKQSLAEDLRPR